MEACSQQLNCACVSPTEVWRAACVPPQSVRAGAKLVTVTTTTTGGQSVPTPPLEPQPPRRTPSDPCHGKIRSPESRAPRSRRFRGDACALSSRSWPLELRLRVAEAAAPSRPACLCVGPGDGGAEGPRACTRAAAHPAGERACLTDKSAVRYCRNAILSLASRQAGPSAISQAPSAARYPVPPAAGVFLLT